MNGFLFDEHLPVRIVFEPSLPVISVSDIGASPTDTQIWQYAREKDLIIVTKDADFSDRLMVDSEGPKVVHLRFGNMRKQAFHSFLAKVWPELEILLVDHNLINVYADRIEVIR